MSIEFDTSSTVPCVWLPQFCTRSILSDEIFDSTNSGYATSAIDFPPGSAPANVAANSAAIRAARQCAAVLFTMQLPFRLAPSHVTRTHITSPSPLMTVGLLLPSLTHRCIIFEMNRESCRFRESVKSTKATKEKKTQES